LDLKRLTRERSDIILSCLRLASLELLSRTGDISWYIQPVGIWSSLESTVAIICASAPVLKPLLAVLFPRFFSTPQSDQTCSLRERPQGQMGANFREQEFGSDGELMVDEGEEKIGVDVEYGKSDMRRPRTTVSIGGKSSSNMSVLENYGGSSHEDLNRRTSVEQTNYPV
jgi:hypothetical protein